MSEEKYLLIGKFTDFSNEILKLCKEELGDEKGFKLWDRIIKVYNEKMAKLTMTEQIDDLLKRMRDEAIEAEEKDFDKSILVYLALYGKRTLREISGALGLKPRYVILALGKFFKNDQITKEEKGSIVLWSIKKEE